DLLTITVEDNGPGITVPAEVITDPFYTTKSGKRTGLGLALLKGAAERAGGRLAIGRSALGGALVEATMVLSHIDRSPMGDLAATLASVIVTSPDLDLRVRLSTNHSEALVRSTDVAAALPASARGGLEMAREMGEKVKKFRLGV
ncbi:MAG: ATP-binding protein, partial [Planctomycetota bacterium]|nr:ATP-binding protein [Planctomycetota bacterium]